MKDRRERNAWIHRSTVCFRTLLPSCGPSTLRTCSGNDGTGNDTKAPTEPTTEPLHPACPIGTFFCPPLSTGVDCLGAVRTWLRSSGDLKPQGRMQDHSDQSWQARTLASKNLGKVAWTLSLKSTTCLGLRAEKDKGESSLGVLGCSPGFSNQ